jgi:hypothetical protein
MEQGGIPDFVLWMRAPSLARDVVALVVLAVSLTILPLACAWLIARDQRRR